MINRLQATRYLVQQLTNEPIIASLGNPKFDLFTAQDRPQNFYMWNSMGMASSMGLGLAIARPEVKVIILDGDGALLMNLNSLPTAAARAPVNLIHVIWDNRQFDSRAGSPRTPPFTRALRHWRGVPALRRWRMSRRRRPLSVPSHAPCRNQGRGLSWR